MSEVNQILSKKVHVIFWTSIAVIHYIETQIVNFLYEVGDPASSSIYVLSWFLWILFAPLVIKFSRKFPFQKSTLYKNILRHLAFGLALLVVLIGIEIGCMLGLSYLFFDMKSTREMLPSFFVYTFHARLITYFFIVAATQSLLYFSRVRDSDAHLRDVKIQNMQLQAQITEVQLKTLKMQIQPHFLFNTHQAIVGLMLKNDIDKAIEMLSGLSMILRSTLDISEEKLIPLEKELKIAIQYLSIQQTRFHDRLKIRIDVSTDLYKAYVPPFILQPLIENAIQHGFAPVSSACLIELQASKTGEKLKLSVRDDGLGIDSPDLKKGIGLKNVQARLRELFQDDFTFLIKNHKERGAIAIIEIPYLEEPATYYNQISMIKPER